MSRQEHPIIESVRADIDGLDFADDDKRQNAEDSIICTVQTLIDRLADSAAALAAKDAALSEMRADLEALKKHNDGLVVLFETFHADKKAAEAQLERAKAEINRLKTPDSYWDWTDPESGFADISEALSDTQMGGVVHLITGKTLDDIWVTTRVLTVDDDGDWDDHEVATFDNPVDAEKCWAESLAAALAIASQDDGEGR